MKPKVGKRIREAREKAGYSQAKLAARIGIAAPNLSDFERDVVYPWPKARRDLVRVLGLSEAELFPHEEGCCVN